MQKIDKVYNILKANENDNIKDIIKDIVVIDGCIAQRNNYENDKNTYLAYIKKYDKYLNELGWNEAKQEKLEKPDKVETLQKEINVNLGLLKIFLIRIAALEFKPSTSKIQKVLDKIKAEKNPQNIYKLYEELDECIISNIR